MNPGGHGYTLRLPLLPEQEGRSSQQPPILGHEFEFTQHAIGAICRGEFRQALLRRKRKIGLEV